MAPRGPCPLQMGKFVGTICLGLATGVSYSTAQITIPALRSLPSAPTAHQALTSLRSRVRRKTHWLTGITACTFLTAYNLASKAKGRKHPFLVYVSTLAIAGGWGIQSWYDRGVVYDALKKPVSIIKKGIADIAAMLGFEDVFVADVDGPNGSAAWNWSYGLGCLPPRPSNMPTSPSMHDRPPSSTSSSSSTTMNAGRGRQYTPSVSIATLSEEDASASLAGSGVFVVNKEGEEEEVERGAITPPATTSRHISTTPNGESVARMLNLEMKLQEASMKTLGAAFAMAVVGIWGDCQ